jgi:hypothetical protein
MTSLVELLALVRLNLASGRHKRSAKANSRALAVSVRRRVRNREIATLSPQERAENA